MGRGVKKDIKQAVKWYKKAARNGNSSALYNLALLSEGGHGMPRNLMRAFHFYERAARLGHLQAQANVAALKELVKSDKTVNASVDSGYKTSDGASHSYLYSSDATERQARVDEGMTPDPNKNYTVEHPSQTLTPSEGTSGNEEVHVSDGTGQAAGLPQEEQVVGMGHELYVHARRDLAGQPSKHGDPGHHAAFY